MREDGNVTLIRRDNLLIAAGYEELLCANGLDSLEGLFNVTNAESLSKPGLATWRERLRLTVEAGGEQCTLYLKRFSDPPLSARRAVRRSGSGASSMAGVEWAWMTRLAADGIPCVKPVAFGEEIRGSRELRSAIITAAAPGASLEVWVGRWDEGDRAIIRNLIEPLAALVARFHERGYIHRDLYLSHVFYDPASPPEESLCLIDLQRVVRPRLRHRRWIIKDLASLNFSAPGHLVSRTDRLRWLTHYLRVSKLDAPAKRLIYRVVGKTQGIAGHEDRRRARWHGRSNGR
ncbi:MAG: hypothetical protein JSU86_15445 [Phycisphaerales bacterium]|nr:MAG: hypothetical protein JSU86_15445 [Phycisphaerales bacterium]